MFGPEKGLLGVEKKVEGFLEESINHDHIIKKDTIKKLTKKPPEPY